MEEKEDFSPQFSGMKSNPFGVPENYFEQFSAQMQQHLKAQSTVSQSRIRVIRPYLAAAAMITLIIALAVLMRPKTINTNKEVAETENIDNLRYYGVDENQIVSYIVDEDQSEKENVESKEDGVVNYLLEEGVNPELMYETAE